MSILILAAILLTYGDKTQVEMAELWEGEISDRTISRALKKIGKTRKKKLTDTVKETRKNDLL